MEPFLIDGHLDLSMNALLYARDLSLDLDVLRQLESGLGSVPVGRGRATVTLPELRQAGVRVVCATVIARVRRELEIAAGALRDDLDWRTPAQAHAIAMGQWAWYRQMVEMSELQWVRTQSELQESLAGNGKIGVLLMMEGADPIIDIQDLRHWYGLGLRKLSLAHFGHSRAAAGTPSRATDAPAWMKDGPLTGFGRSLLSEMHMLSMVLDLTHLGDQSFAEAEALFDGAVCATHAAARSLSAGPRQLSDSQIVAIASRGGVIGIPMHAAMLKESGQANVETVCEHMDHIAQLAGNACCVGLGTDLDGGFGAEAAPGGIERYRDMHVIADELEARGWGEEGIRGVLGGNWKDFWMRVLPAEEA